MWRALGTFQAFGFALVIASAVGYAGCGGGSGDVTGPPGGAGTVDSLVLSLDSADVIVGDTIRLTAEARDANGQVVPGVRLSYTSSDPAVATVSDDGLVTLVDFGEAEIEVAIAGEAGTGASLTPSYSAAMASNRSTFRVRGVPRVVITPGEQTLDPGVTEQYSASVTNVRGQGFSNVQITWSSSQASVASVDAAGLATTRDEGDTEISVTVTAGNGVSRPLQVTARVALHVAVCGGIFRVASWTALAEVKYNTTANVPETRSTYVVNQRSVGSVTLAKVSSQSGTERMVWEGKTSNGFNEVSLDNSLTFPVPPPVSTGVTKEVKTSPIEVGPTAVARLTVNHSAGSSVCTYEFEWGDYLSWEVTNNQGAPPMPYAGLVGKAHLTQQAVPSGPESGLWRLGDPNLPSGQPPNPISLPAKAFSVNESEYYYIVGSTIGASMIIAKGGTWKEATFSYFIHAIATP